jgi:hypothetical protein
MKVALNPRTISPAARIAQFSGYFRPNIFGNQ